MYGTYFKGEWLYYQYWLICIFFLVFRHYTVISCETNNTTITPTQKNIREPEEKTEKRVYLLLAALVDHMPFNLLDKHITSFYENNYYRDLFNNHCLTGIQQLDKPVDIPLHWQPSEVPDSYNFNIYDPFLVCHQWAQDTCYYYTHAQDRIHALHFNEPYKQWLYPQYTTINHQQTLIDAYHEHKKSFFFSKITKTDLHEIKKSNGTIGYEQQFIDELKITDEKERIYRTPTFVFFNISSTDKISPHCFAIKMEMPKGLSEYTPTAIAVLATCMASPKPVITLWLKNKTMLHTLQLSHLSPNIPFTKIAFIPTVTNIMLALSSHNKSLSMISVTKDNSITIAPQKISLLSAQKEYIIDFAVNQQIPKNIALLTQHYKGGLLYSIYKAIFMPATSSKKAHWTIRQIATFSNSSFIKNVRSGAYPYTEGYFENKKINSPLDTHGGFAPICGTPTITYHDSLITIGTKIIVYEHIVRQPPIKFCGWTERYIYAP